MADMADVAKSVPLASFLRVIVVDRVVVAKQPVLLEAQDRVARRIAVEQRGFRVVDRGIQPEHPPLAHQPRRIDHSLGRQEVEASEFIVVAKHTPRRLRGRPFLYRQVLELRQFLEIDLHHIPLLSGSSKNYLHPMVDVHSDRGVSRTPRNKSNRRASSSKDRERLACGRSFMYTPLN